MPTPPAAPSRPLRPPAAVSPSSSRPSHSPSGRTVHAVWLTVSLVVLLTAAVLENRGAGQVALFGFALPSLCAWQRLWNMACPGCGLTRSFVALAHGRWHQAWQFHLVGPLLFGLLALQVPYRSLQLWRLSRGMAAIRWRFLPAVLAALVILMFAAWLWRLVQPWLIT